jgi:hypothetical protein
MEVEASRGYVQISVVVVLLGVLGAISGAESRFSVPANEHAVIVDNIGTYGRKISTKSPLAQKFFDQGLRLVYESRARWSLKLARQTSMGGTPSVLAKR